MLREYRGMNLTPAIVAALAISAAVATPETRQPRCGDVSHAVLVVQKGRDVCGPTIINAQPVSVGFLPTTCAGVLVVDAVKDMDLCRNAESKK